MCHELYKHAYLPYSIERMLHNGIHHSLSHSHNLSMINQSTVMELLHLLHIFQLIGYTDEIQSYPIDKDISHNKNQ